MAPSRPQSPESFSSSKSKEASQHVEETLGNDQFLDHWPLLRNKSPEDLKAINKAVLRKLDWKFLPCVTMMLLMK